MDVTSHTHNFFFNDDGFEVCSICGVCTTLRQFEPADTIRKTRTDQWSEFSNVLINNHIGYIQEVEDEYKKIKNQLKRGYSNAALYAYCTYFVLLKEDIYYSLKQISEIFKLANFPKLFCQIENKMLGKSLNYDISEAKYIFSSIKVYLAIHNQSKYLNQCKDAVYRVRKSQISLKPHFVICVSLYYVLKILPDPGLLDRICNYYSVNVRTLKAYIKLLNLA